MKMKKLLAAALAATMLFSTMVTSVVASAETTANAVDVTIAEIAVGAETYTANFDITFDPAVEGPHLLFDVDATGTLTNIVSNTEGINVYGDEGGTNLAEGMFITESSNKEFSALSVTATFALDEAAKDADVITVDVAVTDNADWDENTIEIAAGSATYTVEAPHECTAGEPVSNNDGTHYIPCADACGKNYAETTACTYVDGFCSVCGYAEPVTEPECDHNVEKVISATPATAEIPEGSIEYICSDCGNTVTETVTYNRFARANTRALVLEAEISLTANVFERDLVRCNEAGANGVIDEYVVQFDEDRADADLYYAYSADAQPMTDPSNGRKYGMLPYGLRSVDMVNNVTMTVFAKVDGQWVTGEVYTDSVQTLANGLLDKTSTSTALKTLLVDMLKYGEAAQINFGINTENLPSIEGYESYASTGDVSYTNNRVMASSSTEAAPFTSTGVSLELSSKILLRPNLQFGNKYYANYTDKYDGMKIVVSYTNFQGERK